LQKKLNINIGKKHTLKIAPDLQLELPMKLLSILLKKHKTEIAKQFKINIAKDKYNENCTKPKIKIDKET